MGKAHADPVDLIEWADADLLNANDYNPNVVFNTELRLLELSILESGWVQPIIVNTNGRIVDGFHRWRLAQDSKPLREKYGGRVPVAVLEVSDADAMLLTIRMNRAKGTHVAVRMSAVVKELIDTHGVPPEAVAKQIGATKAEVDLLYQDSVFKARNLDRYRYSKAWEPGETKIDGGSR